VLCSKDTAPALRAGRAAQSGPAQGRHAAVPGHSALVQPLERVSRGGRERLYVCSRQTGEELEGGLVDEGGLCA
jgi:hypothetical protein